MRHERSDRRPGQLPDIRSSTTGLIWRCQVSGQPPAVRLVLRASPDGHVWASIVKADDSGRQQTDAA